jgi:hypothetical protein
MRDTITNFRINENLSMTISTFARIYPERVKDEHVHIVFFNKHGNDTIEISGGPAHQILKEKYFKPEMLQW